jgi:hypothetical protein
MFSVAGAQLSRHSRRPKQHWYENRYRYISCVFRDCYLKSFRSAVTHFREHRLSESGYAATRECALEARAASRRGDELPIGIQSLPVEARDCDHSFLGRGAADSEQSRSEL